MATLSPTSHDALEQQLRQALEPHLQQLIATLTQMDQQRPFGAIEYTLRDLAHQMVADAHQVALDSDKKRGTTGLVGSARPVSTTPSS
jgi:hypothetical protein